MPIPYAVTRFNRRYGNRVLRHLAGHGPFVELEHVGRKSGTTYRTPMNAWRHGDAMTVALTYGSQVDWLRNARATGGGRMRVGDQVLTLGPPVDLSTETGMRRMPAPARVVLRLVGVTEFVELPIQGAEPIRGRW